MLIGWLLLSVNVMIELLLTCGMLDKKPMISSNFHIAPEITLYITIMKAWGKLYWESILLTRVLRSTLKVRGEGVMDSKVCFSH